MMSNNDVTLTSPSGEGLPPVVYPTLAGVADIIATNIPSLAEVATTIRSSSFAPPPSAPPTHPSIDIMANNTVTQFPSLTGAANVLAYSSEATLSSTYSNTPVKDAASLDSIVSSLASIPSLAGMVSSVANPAVSTVPSAPPHPPFSPGIRTAGDTGTNINQSFCHMSDQFISVSQSSRSLKDVRVCDLILYYFIK